MDWARQQQAKSWERRTAASYAQLMKDQGRHADALQLLRPVYDWFTEGFDTKDLKEAKALLDGVMLCSGRGPSPFPTGIGKIRERNSVTSGTENRKGKRKTSGTGMVRSPHGALDRPFALSEGFAMIDQSSGSLLSHDLNGDTRPTRACGDFLAN